MGNDLKTFAQFPSESLGGVFAPGQNVAINPTEKNAYFGWPLLVLVAAAAFWLWRNRVVRAAAVTIAVLSVLSFGSTCASARPTPTSACRGSGSSGIR